MRLSDTKKFERAAFLVAEDKFPDTQIAKRAGISRATLERWKNEREFAALVRRHVDALRKAVMTRGIADRVRRVAALDDRWKKMQTVIEERGEDPQMEGVPGGKTGLIVHQVKGVGKGDDFQLIDLYLVDAGLLAELRNHEKQAAIELGQWTEKTALTDPTGEKEYAGYSAADRIAEIRALLERARIRDGGSASKDTLGDAEPL